DPDKHVQIERNHSRADVNPAPVPGELTRIAREDRNCQHQQRDNPNSMSRRETMERKEKAGHARQHGGDQEPVSPAIETIAHEQSEQNHKTGEDSDKADQRMNYCINVQYHDHPITSTFARTVTSRFVATAPLALGRCPGTGVACWSE